MRDWRLDTMQHLPLAHPTIAVFVGEGRTTREKAPLLRHVDAMDVRREPVARLEGLDEPCPGGLVMVQVPMTMNANSIAALAREFTLNGFGVILIAPGGCNGLHAALGVTDERLFIDGEADLAPMVTAVADDISFMRVYERMQRPNATLALVRRPA